MISNLKIYVKCCLIVTFFILNFACNRQNEASDQSPINTYALIIGIADYENVADLEFADKDALAFKGFLKSKSGGSVPEENIKTLVNENANTSSVGDAIKWLMESVNADDRVYIYFAGHGDTESLIKMDNGLLLLHKAPANSYIALGYEYLQISYLRSYVVELAMKKAEVLVIIDACRSGELAGGVTGIHSTSDQLMEVWENSIKMLSCQHDELSYEGKQWGEGRGVFSYNLVLGMGGFADANNNNKVTIAELRDYLENEVPKQVAPNLQTPVVQGKSKTLITYVDTLELKDMKHSFDSQIKIFTESNPLSSDEVIEEFLQNQDTLVNINYALYNQFVNSGDLIEPIDKSAYVYFKKLKAQIENETVIRLLERNFIAALQEKAMGVILPIIELETFSTTIEKVDLGVKELELARDLLGKRHYMYESVSIRKYFLEAYSLSQQYLENKDTTLLVKAEEKLFSALDIDTSAAYPYFQLGWIYNTQKRYKDALKVYQKYQILVPNNPRAYNNLGYAYNALELYDSAIIYFEKVIELDSNFAESYNNIGFAYALQGKLEESVSWFQEATLKDLDYKQAHYNLGLANFYLSNYDEAEKCYLRALEIVPEDMDSWYNLACLYSLKDDKEKALGYLNKAIEFGVSSKERIQTDSDFDNIKDTQEFNRILDSL